MATTGLFDLQHPEALLRKLVHDFKALEKKPFDSYLAFNFFVTAEHIPDWARNLEIKKQFALLRVTSHLANGAKHFQPQRHSAVEKTEKQFGHGSGYLADGFIEEPLIVHFAKNEAQEMGVAHMEALVLARRVLEFWLNQFPSVAPELAENTSD